MSRRAADRDRDMDEEIALHVARLTEEYLAAGMTPSEARRAALLRFGPVEAIRETARAQRPRAWLHDLGRDAAYAARTLRRDAALTSAVVLTVALGIGACTAIFSVVDGVLLRPLPYPDSDRLVVLKLTNPPRFPELIVLPAPFVEWRRQALGFAGLAAVRTRSYSLGGASPAVRVAAARITANTLSLLRVRPALGRDFAADEDLAGKGNVVILSHGFWQRHFGGRADALGGTITLDEQPFVVVGVMAPGFQLDAPVDVYTPAAYLPDDPQNRRSLGAHAVEVFARLRPGVTLAQARAEMAVIAARPLPHQASSGGGRWGVTVTPMLEARAGDARPVLLALLGAVAFLLLIACANVASLLLARASARAKEIAVRAALGAGPGRLVRQLLTESLLLALGGAALGLLLAHAGTRALAAHAPADLPRAAAIVVDARAAAFAGALALLAGVGFGLAPAWGATRPRLHDVLKEGGGRAGEGRQRGRAREALVVGEVAIALVLLAGAGLLIRSFLLLQQAPRGFQPAGAWTFSLSLSDARNRDDLQRAAFAERATQRLRALPGVTAAGASQALPFSIELSIAYFAIAGHPAAQEWPVTYIFEATPGYLGAMGIPLRRGRWFDERDRAGAPRVAVINESMARRHFAGEDPLGRRIGRPDLPPDTWAEIVGVVADVRDGQVYGWNAGPVMQAYVPFAQNPYDALSFVVRTSDPGTSDTPAAIRAAMAEVDGTQAIGAIRPLGDLAAEPLARQRFAMLVFAVFAAAALALAAIGIYGVMAYAVARRTGEIGIRLALGARAGDVRRLILRDGARLFALGLGLGLLGAWLLTRSLASLLYGVTPHDPATLAAVAALLALVATLACLVPAQRATSVDPMVALR